MAKKPYNFDELSGIKCGNPDCRRFLKQNVVTRKPSNPLLLCWECWVMKTRQITLAAYKKYRTARALVKREGGDPRAVRLTT